MKKVLFPIVLLSASLLNAVSVKDVQDAAATYLTAYTTFKGLDAAKQYGAAMTDLRSLFGQADLQSSGLPAKVAKKATEWEKKGKTKSTNPVSSEEASRIIEQFKSAHQALSTVSEYDQLRTAKKTYAKVVKTYVKEHGYEGLASQLSGKPARKIAEWQKKNK